MSDELQGKAWVYGDNVDTDVIIPGRYCHLTKAEEVAPHCLEDLDADFAEEVEEGDVIVAGANFGCGSSRELAPFAIKAVGVSAVVAKGFARIFYRNAINIGLPILECPEAVDEAETGDEIRIEVAEGRIRNETKGATYEAAGFPEFIQDLIDMGGLIPWAKERARERIAALEDGEGEPEEAAAASEATAEEG